MTRQDGATVALAITCALVIASPRDVAAQCSYNEILNLDFGPQDLGGLPMCGPTGWSWTDSQHACPHRWRSYNASHSCTDDSAMPPVGYPPNPNPVLSCSYGYCCGCDAADMSLMATRPADAVVPDGYLCENTGCDLVGGPDPETCNGTDVDGIIPFDEGCGNDDHTCKASDQDGAPVRFSSGRVEINPITMFSEPTPEGIFFGYQLTWASHVTRKAAQTRTVNGVADQVPTIHNPDETTHTLGSGWLDNFSDRLYVNVKNKPASIITWQSMDGTVTFDMSTGKSFGHKFELIDRGPNPADGFGRWVVRTTDANAPRQIWSFEEFSFTSYGGAQYVYTLGRLRRHALLTSDLNNLTGRYGYTVNWTGIPGVISTVVDTLGRTMSFDYYTQYNQDVPPKLITQTLSGIRYKASPTGTETQVIALQYDLDNVKLDRVSRPGVGGYTRFLYTSANSPPIGDALESHLVISDVIVPTSNVISTPAIQAPIQSTETAIEHNAYVTTALIGHTEYTLPLGTRSTYPGRDFAYEYRDTRTTQFDLHQDTGPCDPNGLCANGSACRAADNRCYVASIIEHPDNSTRLPTVKGRASGGTGGGGTAQTTGPGSYDRIFASTGSPRRSSDTAGVKTTYGYDSLGRIRCIVRNDDDDEAFATPGSPDTSACAGPTTAQIIKLDYNATTIVKTTPSLLSGNVTETLALNTTTFLPNTIRTIGKTRNIAGTTITLDQTTTFTHDSIGRVTAVNGPLTDTVALDKTTTAYYTTYDGAWPFNLGQVQSVTNYVGTSSSNTPLTATFSEYDVFGVPHRIAGPNGDQVTYMPSADRLTWTVTQIGVGGGTIGVSTVQLNGDGTVRSVLDPDGVCVTYEYTAGTTYVGAPTRIRRSNVNCGSPIQTSDPGEVEVRTYANGDADRLLTITRYKDSQQQFTYSGFTYDTDRRLVNATTLDSGTPFTFGYTDVLPTSIVAPGAPAPGSWRTDTTPDLLARPATLSRFLDATNKQTYTFAYSKPLSPRPTQLSRGYNGSSTSITTFVYDDAGRLVETTVPEAGAPGSPRPTRYEYDVGNRMVKSQVGIGSTAVRTSVYSNDSLGRVTFVDHDTEHPVNCATAPDATPIQDEEYIYDSCPTSDRPAGVTCANAKGRLAISRAILQCSSGQVIKRGRWYDYDAGGRVAQVAYATVTGTTIGVPAISTRSYSSASRLTSYTSPISSVYGTSYVVSGTPDGRPTTVTTSGGSSIATSLTYRAFGPITGLDTPVVQPAQGGSRTLKLRATYRSDDALSNLNWTLFGSGVADINLLKQDFAYGPAGLISTRTDQADILSSRYYGYDSLLRLTCEARGDATTQPSAADCNTSASRLAGLFTFGNGESSTSPPDVRLTSFIKNAGGAFSGTYSSPSVETYTYSSGSGQTQQITRTGSNITIGYDALGRRSFEYNTAEPITSRRDYTYLPSGQLGTVTTYASDGTPLDNWIIRYDAEGHPVTLVNNISGGLSFELFWDDAGRLIAASRDVFRWHYHYVGQTLLAITQESGATVKRFWIVADERGLPYRVLDDQGASYVIQRWDASGWRNIVSSFSGPLLPFGLPGQFILYDRFASSEKRPDIALNRWRAYDPLFGAFLQPDAADMLGRIDPEGYLYGLGNYVQLIDPTGRDWRSWLEDKAQAVGEFVGDAAEFGWNAYAAFGMVNPLGFGFYMNLRDDGMMPPRAPPANSNDPLSGGVLLRVPGPAMSLAQRPTVTTISSGCEDAAGGSPLRLTPGLRISSKQLGKKI